MMKKILLEYANYNQWANKQFTDVIVNLPDDVLKREDKANSFGSIYNTLLHIWDVEVIWWKRMKLEEVVEFPSQSFTGGLIEMIRDMLAQSKHWYEWIEKSTENALLHEFIYKNTKKDQFKQPVFEVLIHLFNHQTYHRGQLVTMLRAAGVTKIPHNQFIEFTRGK